MGVMVKKPEAAVRGIFKSLSRRIFKVVDVDPTFALKAKISIQNRGNIYPILVSY